MVNLRKILAVFLLLTLVAGMFSGCNGEESIRIRSTPEDFADAKIGVFTGASFDKLAKEYYPEAERLYFGTVTDMVLNLQQEKIDGILIDEAFFIPQTWGDDTLSSIEMDMPATEYAVAFPQSSM